MKIVIYSIKDFESSYLLKATKMNNELTYAEEALSAETGGLTPLY